MDVLRKLPDTWTINPPGMLIPEATGGIKAQIASLLLYIKRVDIVIAFLPSTLQMTVPLKKIANWRSFVISILLRTSCPYK